MFFKALSFSLLVAFAWYVAGKFVEKGLFELFEPLLRALEQIRWSL